MRQTALSFGFLILAFLIIHRLSQYSYFRGFLSLELIISLFGVIFFALGLYFSKKYFWRQLGSAAAAQTAGQTGPAEGTVDEARIRELGISAREMEILSLIALGHSNLEIAEQLFLSESTIKKHVSSILVKLDARRRTQAVRVAKDLGILA